MKNWIFALLGLGAAGGGYVYVKRQKGITTWRDKIDAAMAQDEPSVPASTKYPPAIRPSIVNSAAKVCNSRNSQQIDLTQKQFLSRGYSRTAAVMNEALGSANSAIPNGATVLPRQS